MCLRRYLGMAMTTMRMRMIDICTVTIQAYRALGKARVLRKGVFIP